MTSNPVFYLRIVMAMTALSVIQLSTTSVRAAFIDGNDLLRKCSVKETDDTYWQSDAYCTGFIIGALDASRGEKLKSGFCFDIPTGAQAGQMRQVVVKWMNSHPETLHYAAESLVQAALDEAFPCH